MAEFYRRTGSPEVFSAFRAAMRNIDVTSQANRLSDVPTLVVHQRQFVSGSFELAQEVAQSISGARFVVVDGKEEEIRALTGFLDEQRPVREQVADRALSHRELEVLRLIATGRTNQQIADQLVISLNTVLRHVTNILTKTESRNRDEATSYAHRHGLI